MTFEEVKDSLPNGFHDSTIRGIDIDFVNLRILLKMEVDATIEGETQPEYYRRGTLMLLRPYLFFLTPPDPRYSVFFRGVPLNADGRSLSSARMTPQVEELVKRVPGDTTAFVFFLEDWNSYLYLAGASVKFSWDDD